MKYEKRYYSETEYKLICRGTNIATGKLDILEVHTIDSFDTYVVNVLFSGDSMVSPNNLMTPIVASNFPLVLTFSSLVILMATSTSRSRTLPRC